MIELEETRLARVAERQFGARPSQVWRCLSRVAVEGSRCILRELLRERAISSEALVRLIELRDASRPGGFKLVSVLGSGTSATVYSARDDEGREVALKLFNGHPRDGERAGREERALRLANHPAIPRLVATGELRGRRWLAIEKVAGGTLETLVRRRLRLSWPAAVEIGIAIARALGHCHRRGLVHRDVKPANIVVAREGAYLIDFGLAVPQGIGDRRIAGTPRFMAPEQAQGRAPDPRGDVYSLASVLFLVLTGTFPHQAESAIEALQVVADPAIPARSLASTGGDFPAPLVEAIDRALEKDPANRFQDAETFARALAHARLSRAAGSLRDLRDLTRTTAA